VRVHSHRLDIGAPIGPVFLPIFGSQYHSSIEKSFVLKMKITLVLIAEDIWNMFQDACEGSRNMELNTVSK